MAITKVSTAMKTAPTSAEVSAHATTFDDNQLKEDIALLAFKQASGDASAKYGLIDQKIDVFSDLTGVDAGGSTNEIRNTGNYVIGGTAGSSTTTKLTSGTSWTVPAGVYNGEVLIVAGGGGGGTGGGGGAGGVVHDTNHILTAGASVTYAIGAAGAGGTYTSNSNINGGNTTFSSLTAVGGGGGGCRGMSTAGTYGQDGGSGGGGDYSGVRGGLSTQQTAGTASGGTITAYGTNGGRAVSGDPYLEGGGGGATEAGGRAQWPNYSGNGGRGLYTDIGLTDATTNYGRIAAGGAGSRHHSFGGNYGQPGQDGGGTAGDATGGNAVAASYGSGGGGADTQASSTGGTGTAGVVFIKYTPITEGDLTLVSAATTAESQPTKGDIVLTASAGVGSLSIGDGTDGDVRAWVSRDNGSTYTQFTLTDQGDTAGHTILTAHDLTISGQPAGTSMRFKVTTHSQSASKQTRIHAVSLGWS